MKKVLILVVLSLLSASPAFAKPIASCGNEKGQAYYPFAGDLKLEQSGWTDDAITGGKVTLDQDLNGKFDLLYLDATGSVASARNEGAAVILSSASEENLSIIVAFPGNTTEVYDFYKNTMGVMEYTHVVSKPALASVPKAGVYVGSCDFIDFEAFH